MFKLTHVAACASGLLIVLAWGCAAEMTEGDVTSEAVITEASLRLYEGLDVPFGRCDVGTDLVLSPITNARIERSGSVGRASLRESVPRDCDRVDADPRTYELLYGGEDCGSAIYVANLTVDGTSRSLKIIDHRSRLCRDRVPAPVVVEEESLRGSIRRLYARDPMDVSCEHSGKRYGGGTTFRDKCNTCTCTPHGELTCTAMSCIEPEDRFSAL